jgi:hypothetical protein
VPTGGAGFAAPAGHWSFTIAVIFFAIPRSLRFPDRGSDGRGALSLRMSVRRLPR